MKSSREKARRASALAALFLVLLAPAGRAGDFYVDSAAGDDANGGTSPTDSWRTITHALASVPNPAPGSTHTIHVAEGLHDAALGEVFPLGMRPELRLVGAGPASTILDGGGAALTLVAVASSCPGLCEPFGADTLVAGFSLRDAARGVSIGTSFYDVALTLEDLVITQMSQQGIAASGGGFAGSAPIDLVLRRVRVTGPVPVGFEVFHGGEGTASSVRLEDCAIGGTSSDGLRLSNAGDTASLSATLVRSAIDASDGHGVLVRYSNLSSITVELRDTAVVRSAGDGIFIDPASGMGGNGDLTLLRSTIAANAGAGLRLVHGGGLGANPTRILSSIVAGNGDDLVEDPFQPSVVEIAWSDIQDGDYQGVNGTFAADPLFVDAAGGDFRLSFASPCVDAGDPADPGGSLDLGGYLRPIDGDLDLALRVDVGAHELAPLWGGGDVQPGGMLELELFGPAGSQALLMAMRGNPLDPPDSTPFGLLYLNRGTLIEVATLPTAPTGAPFSRALPADPALIGTVITMQTLVQTGTSPPRVLSNPRTVVVVP